MEGFEYAIRKDVRNNPIVREVDETRQRELWKSVAVGGLFVVMLLFWAWQQFELLRHGYRLEEMQRQRAAEEETARHLRLEIETLRSPKRIEQLASGLPASLGVAVLGRAMPAHHGLDPDAGTDDQRDQRDDEDHDVHAGGEVWLGSLSYSGRTPRDAAAAQ